MKKAPCIAVFGTGSDVGKSIIATALCRIFANHGIKVAPFKAQNMSNNSGITPDGLEMGRAQIVQAEAAKISPHVDMNPILLKPTTDIGAQIVLLGLAVENSTAAEYHKKKEQFVAKTCEALDRLRKEYDLVVIEGAGSCAEVNLMPHDIVNFRIAEYANAGVILVGDIHRGGIFGQIVGTLECIDQKYKDMIKGFIINRFRGDLSLFEDGIHWIQERTNKKVFGVLPWYNHIKIEDEDSVVIEKPKSVAVKDVNKPSIAVIRIPHISNFTDFDPLRNIDGINLYFIENVQDLSCFNAIIIPGSKNSNFDLEWIKSTGWALEIRQYVDKGGHVLGICGGYQIIGRSIKDPDGLEGKPGNTQDGLNLIPVETVLKSPKTTTLSNFSWDGVQGTGYEIHMGQTKRMTGGKPMFQVHKRNRMICDDEDGAISDDFKIMGTYMHGLFDAPGITKMWLASVGIENIELSLVHGCVARNNEYEMLAQHFQQYVDVDAIKKFI